MFMKNQAFNFSNMNISYFIDSLTQETWSVFNILYLNLRNSKIEKCKIPHRLGGKRNILDKGVETSL